MLAAFAIPSIIHVAYRRKLLDQPNLRSIHTNVTPRLGGIAIFAAFLSGFLIFGEVDFYTQKVLAASMLVFFLGVQDDLMSISPFKKVVVQVLAAGIIVMVGEIYIRSFSGIFFIYEIPIWLGMLISFIVIIAITNAVNLIDGMDGLAGSLLSFSFFVFGLLFITINSSVSILCFSIFGAVGGFLRFNITSARIFMGDNGSLVLGFLLATVALLYIYYSREPNAPIIALSIVGLPILDTFRVFISRILNGKSPFRPDKNHIHHVLLDKGLVQPTALFVLVIVQVILFSVVFYFRELSPNVLFGIWGISSLFILTAVEYLKRAKHA
ncbi:MAG: undecaprenyl/decaprenyl-phosphate alpha-N-acetylglucosaminyl 1-phosphate transferase [Cyclobacteriaceae bacterium]|nr:undecaprenyl/decaprenyl-phosphate alpha-N-acetylglucosaminyl 1-phosphate transferase [Cyclobacteriaceae bacterium]